MTLYRSAQPETLRVVPLDQLTLIYHRASGITHIVDAPVPEILEALGDQQLTLNQLLQTLADRYDLTDPDPMALAIRLDELVTAGLVARA